MKRALALLALLVTASVIAAGFAGSGLQNGNQSGIGFQHWIVSWLPTILAILSKLTESSALLFLGASLIVLSWLLRNQTVGIRG
ncbi:MAG TPA: hypothetical protein VKZ53_26505 [Candidatus Angelobacter sp.]|nr:hypothetical protein [Candidatus Angelobacter sp.]